MVETHTHFDKRLRDLGRKHKAMGRGYTTRIRSDGLIVVRPKRARVNLPVKGLAIVAIGFFGFKAFMLASMGPATYSDRLGTLADGSGVEKAGAWVMQIDPITQAMANKIGPILR